MATTNHLRVNDVVSTEDSGWPSEGSHYSEETSCDLSRPSDSLGTVPVLYPWLQVGEEVEAFMKGTSKFIFHNNESHNLGEPHPVPAQVHVLPAYENCKKAKVFT